MTDQVVDSFMDCNRPLHRSRMAWVARTVLSAAGPMPTSTIFPVRLYRCKLAFFEVMTFSFERSNAAGSVAGRLAFCEQMADSPRGTADSDLLCIDIKRNFELTGGNKPGRWL